MTSTQPEAWKHHFVPRSLLRYFLPEGGSEYLYVFDKHTGKSFRASLMNAGSEKGFNSYKEDGATVNFERDFDGVDSLLAARLKEIHLIQSICELSDAQRQDWAVLVATQLLRTPIIRSTMIAVAEHLDQDVRNKFGVPLGDIPTENVARKAAREMFRKRDKFKALLASKDMVLYAAPEGCAFRISDRPVMKYSTLPYGDVGLDALGAAVFMPLGQRLMLAMFCPSVRFKLNKIPIERLGLPAHIAARLVALREGLATGEVVHMDEEEVERHNWSQIANCSRFVYGPADAFEDVRSVIATNPKTRSVRSSIKMGKIGAGPAPRPAMPAGSWLVLIGRTEGHMLEVTNVTDSYPLEATVLSRAVLAIALLDGPFKEMQYYVDKQQMQHMRDVQLQVLEDATRPRVQLRHANQSLDALMGAIERRR
jgi:hypothetical protein